MKNEGGKRPTFTVKVYPFCFFSTRCYHSSHPNGMRGGGVWQRGRGSGRGGGGLAEGEGVWQMGEGSGRGGGGLPRGGLLHSKVWTDANMNAAGF